VHTEPFAKSALGKPLRNVLAHTEPFVKSALGKPSEKTAGRLATASKPVRNALGFAVDDSVAARFLVLQN
jgi:hypothetical protein